MPYDWWDHYFNTCKDDEDFSYYLDAHGDGHLRLITKDSSPIFVSVGYKIYLSTIEFERVFNSLWRTIHASV